MAEGDAGGSGADLAAVRAQGHAKQNVAAQSTHVMSQLVVQQKLSMKQTWATHGSHPITSAGPTSQTS